MTWISRNSSVNWSVPTRRMWNRAVRSLRSPLSGTSSGSSPPRAGGALRGRGPERSCLSAVPRGRRCRTSPVLRGSRRASRFVGPRGRGVAHESAPENNNSHPRGWAFRIPHWCHITTTEGSVPSPRARRHRITFYQTGSAWSPIPGLPPSARPVRQSVLAVRVSRRPESCPTSAANPVSTNQSPFL